MIDAAADNAGVDSGSGPARRSFGVLGWVLVAPILLAFVVIPVVIPV